MRKFKQLKNYFELENNERALQQIIPLPKIQNYFFINHFITIIFNLNHLYNNNKYLVFLYHHYYFHLLHIIPILNKVLL